MRDDKTAQPSAALLVVMAHPDDAEIWCGGTICKHGASGGSTILVSVSCATRSREADESAKILGASVRSHDILTRQSIFNVINEVRPAVVVTHSNSDCHVDHRTVADQCLAAVKDTRIKIGLPSRLYFCDTYNSLEINGLFSPTHIVDVSNLYDRKVEAIKKHVSQFQVDWLGMVKRQNAIWGARIGVQYAEAFKTVPILGQIPGVCLL